MGLFNVARADLNLVSSKNELADTAYGHLISSNNQHFWISAGHLSEKPFLNVSDFSDMNFDKAQIISISYLPILISQKSKSTTSSALLVGLNGNGIWLASELKNGALGAFQSSAINNMGNITETLSTNNGHFVAGSNLEGFPEIQRLNTNLKGQFKTVFVSTKKGEVSSLFEANKKIFTIVNFGDATSELHEISANGKVKRMAPMQGGASTGISYGKDSIVVTYRIGKQIVVEKFDSNFQSKWQLKLYEINGVSTKKNQLVELANGVALVSGTKNQLRVSRISDNGVALKTSIEKDVTYLIPPIGSYLAMAKGDAVHIRAQARKRDNATDGNITSLYFVEN
jgi:hypothetical protein